MSRLNRQRTVSERIVALEAEVAALRKLITDRTGHLLRGIGSPEGNRIAPVGTIYQRTDGSAGASVYIKDSGTGATGWRAL